MRFYRPRNFYTLMSLMLACLLLHSCTILEKLEALKQEADEVLINHPKDNYNNAYIDLSHTQGPIPGQYEVLENKLSENGFSFIESPALNGASDTQLLAALREDIGTLIIPEPNKALTGKELRALELFVIFGGRIIVTTPIAGRTSSGSPALARRFGINISDAVIPESSTSYYPDIIEASEPGEEPEVSIPGKGVVMDVVSSQLALGFHEYDQVVMLNPHQLMINENSGLFSHEVLVEAPGAENSATVIKALPKAGNTVPKGYMIMIGDAFIAKAPVEGGTANISKVAYQGGMLTSGNYKFMINLITQSENPIVLDDTPPRLNLSFPPTVREGIEVLRPNGDLTDRGGVAKITYSLNNSAEIEEFNAFDIRGDRYGVDNRLLGALSIYIPEPNLQLGVNTLRVTATDQFLNQTTQNYTFTYALTGTGRFIEITSNLPNSEEINPLMGLEAKNNHPKSYANRSYFGGFLSNIKWDGPIEGCFISEARSLRAFQEIQTGPMGGGRIKSMDMPTLNAVSTGNTLVENVTFHFDKLELDRDALLTLNHKEIRDYNNLGRSKFYIQFEGVTIISATMNNIKVVLEHGRPMSCDDDIVNFTSDVLPTRSLVISPGLTKLQLRVASAIMNDFEGSRGLRYTGMAHIPIFHRSNSEYIRDGGVLSYPLGVTHPSGLSGFARIDVVR